MTARPATTVGIGTECDFSVVTFTGHTTATFSRLVNENPPTDRATTPAKMRRAPRMVPGLMALKVRPVRTGARRSGPPQGGPL